MRVKFYYLGLLCFCCTWGVTTTLCYYGIVTFDTRSLAGSMLSGLILSASLLSMLGILKIIFDQFWDRFLKKPNETETNTRQQALQLRSWLDTLFTLVYAELFLLIIVPKFQKIRFLCVQKAIKSGYGDTVELERFVIFIGNGRRNIRMINVINEIRKTSQKNAKGLLLL